MICEICGIRRANRKVLLEGAWINVCDICAKEIDIKESIKTDKKIEKKKTQKKIEIYEEFIDERFHEKLRKYRESKNLKQEEMARLLGIKESLYKSLEEGRIKPSIELAKKIEKIIGEKIIVQERMSENIDRKEFKLTVADVIEFEE